MNVRQMPVDILLAIMKKISSTSICRLRQTCSLLNDIIERYNEILAKQPQTGISLGIFGDNVVQGVQVCRERTSLSGERLSTPFIVGADLEKRLSAISFTSIYLMNKCNLADLMVEAIMNTVRRAKLTCDLLFISGIPSSFVSEILSFVRLRNACMVFQDKECENTFLRQLRKMTHKHKMHIRFRNADNVLNLFEAVKDFYAIYADDCSVLGMKQFLQDLQTCSVIHILKHATCTIPSQEINRTNDLLYSGIDSVKTVFDLAKIEWYFRGKHKPVFVRTVECTSKRIIIFEYRNEICHIFEIFIVENSEAAEVETISRELRIDADEVRRAKRLSGGQEIDVYSVLKSSHTPNYLSFS